MHHIITNSTYPLEVVVWTHRDLFPVFCGVTTISVVKSLVPFTWVKTGLCVPSPGSTEPNCTDGLWRKKCIETIDSTVNEVEEVKKLAEFWIWKFYGSLLMWTKNYMLSEIQFCGLTNQGIHKYWNP